MTAPAPPAVLALGNFDGVHIGHRAVIAAARAQAQTIGAPLAAAVFEPHPRRFFQPMSAPFRLQSSAQRARALAAEGVERLFEIGFDAALAQMSDEQFAERELAARIGARHVCVGADFRFGHGRAGDVESLARLGQRFGFGVTAVAPVVIQGARVSSTAIRNAIGGGDMDAASSMLGRPWAIEGEVVRGFQRGREFGFPTANVALGDYARPRLGVYAVRLRLAGAEFDGVANVGVNPTVGALATPVLETHVFDFSEPIYGQVVEVALVSFLRDEAKFDGVDALKAQMAKDCDAARAALSAAGI